MKSYTWRALRNEADEFVEGNRNLQSFTHNDRIIIRDHFVSWYADLILKDRYFESLASAWLLYVQSLTDADAWQAHLAAVRLENLADYQDSRVKLGKTRAELLAQYLS